MITRTQARKALTELQQQQTQSTTLIKPPLNGPVAELQQSSGRVKKSTSSVGLQSAEGVANIEKKMHVISLDSDSEHHHVTDSQVDVIDLSESSKSVMDISSSDESDDSESDISEDEDEDEDESEMSEDEYGKRKPSSSSPAGELLAEEVIKLIRGGDLKNLKVDNCRSYLRNYKLRVTGTKPVLIDRIKQHIELKEGGLRNYDKSTFIINCTGDVCKGDVVMFDQMVYDKYDVAYKSASQLGRRTVAGRVVKESYGAQRQQHTFTVEVLWSTGYQPLPPMKQLLVKGRNLYKRRTFRQRWADEGERRRSLDEKHERGAAARHVRATKQGRFKGSARTLRPDVQQKKQLANPYTNTLASKENSTYASQHTATITTQSHLVHSHTTLAPKDNYLKVTGTGRHGNQQGVVPQSFVTTSQARSVSSSSRYYVHSTQTYTALGWGPSERVHTSLDRHRQWFKPMPPVPSSNVMNASIVNKPSSPLQNRPISPHHNRSTSPLLSRPSDPLPNKLSSPHHNRPLAHDRPSSPYQNRPSSQHQNRPSSPYQNRPTSYQNRPSSPYHDRPSSPYHNRPSSPYHNRPSSPYHNRPSSPYHNRPSSPYHNRPSSPYHHRPSSPHQNRPSSSYQSRPSSPYHHRSSSTHQNRPSSPYQNRTSSPYHHRPSSPYQNRPSSPYCNQPTSVFPNRPSSPLPNGQTFPLLNRPASPLLDRPCSPLLNRPASPLLDRPCSPLLTRPSLPVLKEPTLPLPNGSTISQNFNPIGQFRAAPLGDLSLSKICRQKSAPVSKSQVPANGFPCPTENCKYRGSRYCSSGVCYYCCKKKGGHCPNPNHRPQDRY